jgi:radical SAM protein with 4Fe4S-binding SPASM domain
MTSAIAEQVLIQTAPYTDYVTIAGRGEPLLCTNLYEILEMVVKYNPRFRLITNGDHLSKHIDDIHRILNLHHTSYNNTPKLTINCYDGEDQMRERKKLYDYKSIQFTAKRRTDDMDNIMWRINKKQVTNRGGSMGWTNVDALDKPCYVLFHKTFIDYNGDVNLCCHDWKIKASYGNIMKTPFKEIWETGKLHQHRIGLMTHNSRKNYDACAECDSLQDESKCIAAKNVWECGTNKPVVFGGSFEA